MRFRMNNRFHKSLRTRSFAIERDCLTDIDTITLPLGFLEFDCHGEFAGIRSQVKLLFFPAPSSPDIRQHQPLLMDFDYRTEVSPILRLAYPNSVALEQNDRLTWKDSDGDGYFNWRTDEVSNPNKYFVETYIQISDRLIEYPGTLQERKYRVTRVETIGTLQDIYFHNINTVQ